MSDKMWQGGIGSPLKCYKRFDVWCQVLPSFNMTPSSSSGRLSAEMQSLILSLLLRRWREGMGEEGTGVEGAWYKKMEGCQLKLKRMRWHSAIKFSLGFWKEDMYRLYALGICSITLTYHFIRSQLWLTFFFFFLRSYWCFAVPVRNTLLWLEP